MADSSASSETTIGIAYYEEIKNLPNQPNALLIDVREPNELEQTGVIPTSINIPLADVEHALSNSMQNDRFQQLYGRPKPTHNTPIIFTCRSGRRVIPASESAQRQGYINIKNYKGSWLEWAERALAQSK